MPFECLTTVEIIFVRRKLLPARRSVLSFCIRRRRSVDGAGLITCRRTLPAAGASVGDKDFDIGVRPRTAVAGLFDARSGDRNLTPTRRRQALPGARCRQGNG